MPHFGDFCSIFKINGYIYHRQILGRLENPQFLVKNMLIFSKHHNFAIIGLILEILDVLSTSYYVLSNFGTFVR